MKICQTSLNIVFPPIKNFRKNYINSEEKLIGPFLQPTLLPVPDNADHDIPRVVATTRGGHSTLNMGLSVASFVTTYDNEYTDDWSKCQEYIENHTAGIDEFLCELTDRRTFVGLITNLELDGNNEGTQRLKQILFDNNKFTDAYDISCKLTYLIENRYFVNATISNLRRYSGKMTPQADRIVITDDAGNDISVMLDINDRYISTHEESYVSDKEAIDRIFELTSDFINNKLICLIESGEIGYA